LVLQNLANSKNSTSLFIGVSGDGALNCATVEWIAQRFTWCVCTYTCVGLL